MMTRPLIQRRWFRDTDGTYFRNCPLIMNEQRELLDRLRCVSPLRIWTIRKIDQALDELFAEWQSTWRTGLTRKDELAPGDVVVPMGRFRDVYPDKPGLWFLDEHDSKEK